MLTLFWLMLFLIFYTYIGYPLLIFLLSFFINNPVRKYDIEPAVSLLIAAYNEEKHIREKIENSLSLDYPKEKLEIIVVSDGSTDKTDDIVREYKNRNVILYRVEGRVGKTEARNRAVKVAKGEIIVFSDATTIYKKDVIRKLVRNFSDSRVGLVSGRYKYVDATKNASTGWTSTLFWNYENLIKSKQITIGTLTGASGCINAFRKNLYIPLPEDIIEDLVEPLEILKSGYRIVFEPDALAYEMTTENTTQEFKMRVRVISGGMRGIWYARKVLNPFRYPFVSFQLYSHKILRWSVPIFAILLFIANFSLIRRSQFYYFCFILQSTFYLLAIAGLVLDLLKIKIKIKVILLPLYFCTLNLASLVALIKSLKGEKKAKWETAR